MAKPQIQPRKPGQARPLDLVAAERFLHGTNGDDAAVQHPNVKPPEINAAPTEVEPRSTAPSVVKPASAPPRSHALEPRTKKTLRTRKRDGRTVRQTTLYFDLDLAKQLAVYCAEHELDQSDVVAVAVRRFLETP